jgi:hypothetical protein
MNASVEPIDGGKATLAELRRARNGSLAVFLACFRKNPLNRRK